MTFLKRQTSGSVVCVSCGSLVGVRDETCFNCGRRNPGLWGFAPLLRSLGNDLGFVQLVVWGCGALYVVSLLLSGREIGLAGGLFFILSPDLDGRAACSQSSRRTWRASFCWAPPAQSRCLAWAAGGQSSARAGFTAACFISSST